MEDLNEITPELVLSTNKMIEVLREMIWGDSHQGKSRQGKSRAGSTPYASKRKRKKRK